MSASPVDGGVVVVTGASSGIGAELVRRLAGRAAVLVLVARRRGRLEELAASLSHTPSVFEVRPCDLTDPVATAALGEAVVAEHGRVDVLVNNAGMGDIGLFEACDPAKLERMLAVNVVGLTVLTRAVLPAMVAAGRGGVLNVSSGFGLVTSPGFSAYVGTKHYVTGFSESLRSELAGTGVRVVQVCPGPVATEFEAVAGNPLGQGVPSVVELSAGQCAEEALAAFDRDRALLVPGWAGWALVHLGWWTPRVLMRAVSGLGGRLLRRQLAAPVG